MTPHNCSTCLKPIATFVCGLCHEPICKKCTQFIDEDQFSFLPSKSPDLSHSHYCVSCFNAKIAPEIANYNKLMAEAGNIYVFFKGQGKEIRNLNIKRPDILLEVHNCPDYDETILRLAFFAAQGNYNVLVDVEVVSEKIQNGSFQSLEWHGTAIPSYADPEKLSREVHPKYTKW